ncbi:MAG: quinol:electron acceptor oxidoreductase subunit ActD [Chloroflexota bacterium]
MIGRSRGTSVLGLFDSAEPVAQARVRLRDREGIKETNLEVLTDAPYPVGAFGEEPPRHHLAVFIVSGGTVGLLLGLLITVGTQLAYPLVTGGKPILSIPPMVNVIFETIMLFAIVFGFFGVLLESRLLTARGGVYDPRISEGLIGLAVTRLTDDQDEIIAVMRAAGAVDVVVEEE